MKLALHEWHVESGAKMLDFAGFDMPLRYSSDKEEHIKVRQDAGVFDVSHMGEFILEGENALALIQKISVNDATQLSNGQVQYTCMTNERGGIVDDMLVYKLGKNKYMLVVNASNIKKDWDWIQKNNGKNNGMSVRMTNISDETCLFAVQGPNATAYLQKLTEVNLSDISFYAFAHGTIGGVEDVILSATGYTGAGGFELYVPKAQALDLWKKIIAQGIAPVGLAARDTLRMEKGFCLYGNDIHDETSPLEASLGWITKFNHDFIARDILEKEKANGIKRRLVAFEVDEHRAIPRSGYKLVNEEKEEIGTVTSGSFCPSNNKGMGMGYIPRAYKGHIYINIRNRYFSISLRKR